MKKTLEIVGKNVRERRESLNMTQDDLAKKAKSSLTTINRLEKGKQGPRLETLSDISKALGVSEDVLFDGLKEVRPESRGDIILEIIRILTPLEYSQLGAVRDSIKVVSHKPKGGTSTGSV